MRFARTTLCIALLLVATTRDIAAGDRQSPVVVGEKPSPYFGDYPPDFFDFIVIDECHRGGASDESNWRGILDYFSPAVQLGLTATPKRKDNIDTYAYFGEPIYVYSLTQARRMVWATWGLVAATLTLSIATALLVWYTGALVLAEATVTAP